MSARLVRALGALLVVMACSRSREAEPEKQAEPAASGTPEARAHFDRGLVALHSFWYDEAEREFQAAIDADRELSMAWWGLAMSKSPLLWGGDRVDQARAILAGLPHPDRLSPRDQAWVQAARALFGATDLYSSRRAFAAAMEEVHERFPDDESATFLAAALLARMRPGDPDEAAVRERAGALAAEVFARNPKHPGAAHYLIHAYDTAALAARALPAARAWATIAPEAPHARHMPAHVFARLGLWKEAIASCQSAWDASLAAAARHRLGADHRDLHSLSWLVEMNFELGHRRAADAALELFAGAVRDGLSRENRTAYINQVASYLVRTGDWKRADQLLAVLDTPATDAADPQSAIMEVFERRAIASTRARAAAGLRDVRATEKWIGEVRAVDAQLHEVLVHSQPPEMVARQEQENERTLRALLARARGDQRALLAVLEEMDTSDPDPPGEVGLSASILRESVADALLALGRAGEALAAYEAVVRDHPGRAHSMLGAARAAKRAGKAELARTWYARLAEQWSEADDGTDGLAEVRAAARR
jgi:tetratricopeptide (TPR) repeat protein